jgi:hypothetical protein
LSDQLVSYGVGGALRQAHAMDFPHAFAMHITRPVFQFRDRGKSTVVAD